MAKNKSAKSTASIIIWIVRLVYKLIPILITGQLIFQILGAITPFVVNYSYGLIIDGLIKSSPTSPYLWLTPFIIFLLIRIFGSFTSQVSRNLQIVSDRHIENKLRQSYVQKISQLDYQHFDDKNTSNLIAKVNDEYSWRTRQALADILELSSSLFSFIATVIIIFNRYWYLGLLLLVAQIPSFIVNKKWSKMGWKIHHESIDQLRVGNEIHSQLVNKKFLSELKINQSIDYLFNRFAVIFNQFTSLRVRLRQDKLPSDIFFSIFDNIVLFACLLFVIRDILNGQMTVGLFTFYFSAMRSTGDYFSTFFNRFVSLSEQSMYLYDFKKVMGLQSIIKNGRQKLKLTKPPLIEFVDVSFKYPNSKRFILNHLNLSIKSGQEIAIVGQNGAGKTTLIKLLCRFYDPTSGQVLINGVDIRNVDINQWYRYLSILFQEFTIYPNLSLRENVIIGKPQNSSLSKINQSLHQSEASDFVAKYEKGIDSLMGQKYGGEEPSWGQWQKIAISRIFYRDTPIMILDEPTASIDATSEAKIFKRLYHQNQNKTIIIVSHRFSTVRNAQRIIVLDQGKIAEEGSHKELLNLDGLYAKSFKLQATGYLEN